MMKKRHTISAAALFIFLAIVFVVAWVLQREPDPIPPQVVETTTAPPEPTVPPTPSVTPVVINDHPTNFHTYTQNGVLLFPLEAMADALARTQAYLYFWYGSDHDFPMAVTEINHRRYATIEDIAAYAGVTLSQEYGQWVIDTHEPYISPADRTQLGDFLWEHYPQLFTYQQVFENIDGFYGYASNFSVARYKDSGALILTIFFQDVDSRASKYYLFSNGQYQVLAPDALYENPNVQWLVALWHDIYHMVNQQLWHRDPLQTPAICAQIPEDILHQVEQFFRTREHIQVDAIGYSHIYENLLRVDVWHLNHHWNTRYWLELQDGYITRYTVNYRFYANTTRWEYP